MTTTFGLFRSSPDAQPFAAGQVVFREGEPGHVRYVVSEGEVELSIGGRVIATASKGEMVGEMALIDAGPRSATVTAKVDSRLVPIDERRFKFLITQTPQLAIQVMKVMTERLRESHARETRPAGGG